MPFEDELGDAMRRTGDSFQPSDRPALVDGGVRRGRRRVALRRSAAVSGSVLALAAVAVGGAYGGGLIGGSSDTSSVAAPSEPSEPSEPGEAKEGKGKGTSAKGGEAKGGEGGEGGKGGKGGITKEQMISTLKGLLPKGEVSQEDGRGIEGDDPLPYASLVHDDGEGAAAVSLSLSVVEPGGITARQSVACPSAAVAQEDTTCSVQTLADGSTFMMYQGYEYPDRREDTKLWRAVLVTPQGALVDASEHNAPAQKGAKVSRENPPLTPEQMKSLVTDAQWKTLAVALGKPAKEPRQPAGIAGDGVQQTLLGLLPKGLTKVAQGGEGDYGFVVVNDGKGKSLVQINVQSDMRDVAGELISNGGEVTTLPDGTKVMEKKQSDPDQKGGANAVGWTVDTLRPDGFRVVIMAFNSGAQGQDATRSEPALTMAQLRSIALADKWRVAGGA
ncbi:hypothetical protein AB0M39_21100 [Streptomyces sp. NPDC051907]|uniref:hypothetical protein n=1 Tax=Streptomyces sp. NPDC051907 TaxID=3155284 RepID=UPI00343E2888